MGIIRTVDRSQNFQDVGFLLRSGGIASRFGSSPILYPQFISVGTAYTTTTDFGKDWPTGHREGDLGILVVETSGNDTTINISGWTHIPGSPVVDIADATGTKLNVLWKFATSTAEPNAFQTDPGDHAVSILMTWRNVRRDVPPGRISATDTKTVASTSVTFPSVTTPCDNCRVFMIASSPRPTLTAGYTTPTHAGLTSITELYDGGTNAGNGGELFIAQGRRAASGATGTGSSTSSNSVTNAIMVFVLEPEQLLKA